MNKPTAAPVTAVVLTRDEEANIRRCVSSLGWCDQILVIDSGSTDGTLEIARDLGAEVYHQDWLGFAQQRQWAMEHPAVRNDWVYFVDADEWVSEALSLEAAAAVDQADAVGFSQRRRTIFLGQWIRHAGWYGVPFVRLFDRRHARWDTSANYAERVIIEGTIGCLHHDLVDDDQKGLASWMAKHVRYADLEAERRRGCAGGSSISRVRERPNSMPLARAVAKEVLFPRTPFKPLSLFVYLFVIRAGWKDGRIGLTFCLLQAWHEHNVGQLVRARSLGIDPARVAQGGSGPLSSQLK